MQKALKTQEEYEEILHSLSKQIAGILSNGKAVEIDISRRGLKIYSFRRKYEQLQKEVVSYQKESVEKH